LKPLEEQDHYELLEISRQANREEIIRAYQMARALYADESMAGLSVFDAGDADAICDRVESAYKTLMDAGARRAYDDSLDGAAVETPEGLADEAAEQRPGEPTEAPEGLEAEEGEFGGARLRRMRVHRGIELEDVAEVTKVNPTYLRFIEEERFDDLPAAVYVRGFVLGYAGCIGLDAHQAAKSYMSRYEESRSRNKRRLFGRR